LMDRWLNPLARKAEHEWQQLCDAYLPIRVKGSIWRYSRKRLRGDLSQGWKLHVSATILSACAVLRLIAPYLKRREIWFKAPKSLAELHKLNSGIYYGFSQVGKFVTVYPQSAEAAAAIASELHALTAKFTAPMVPYDNALRSRSCVYYRYGSFSLRLKTTFRKKRVLAIARPDGKLVPDSRGPRAAVPHWLTDLFQSVRSQAALEVETPLETDYTGYEALTQRGRGGIYQARDVSSMPRKLCVIKEGRRYGETDWLGRDGFFRIKREAEVLRSTGTAGVPRVLRTFRANGCYYLVTERIAGKSLQQVLASRQRMSTRRMLDYCAQMARIVADIHAAGWAWRDCKPDNFLVEKNHKLRALDFEGACRLDETDPPWGATPGYSRPRRSWDSGSPEAMDLYALGTSIMQLTARSESTINLATAFKRDIKKRNLPRRLFKAIQRLRSPSSKRRPSARATQTVIELHTSSWNLRGGADSGSPSRNGPAAGRLNRSKKKEKVSKSAKVVNGKRRTTKRRP
jgi:tRNA A-37 threonylcarbamoyl transferase component Bud32